LFEPLCGNAGIEVALATANRELLLPIREGHGHELIDSGSYRARLRLKALEILDREDDPSQYSFSVLFAVEPFRVTTAGV